ncbi:NAD-dependent epimerase/dehydratase family protein [Pedobacter sp. GSP4]|uniref:NAD-dependent epimerase/dehydratase family protein n=1 Tax=Pedobacter sp. GSP4 TaxID=3453716 RepID=UPI003EEAC79F
MLSYFKNDLQPILDNTKDCWDEVRGKTIFLTGGTGFFGMWLQMSFIYINRELNLGAKLILLTRDKNKFLNKYSWVSEYSEIDFLEGNVLDFKFIDDPVDYVIHAATEASVKLNLEQPLTMFETVVNGTKRVLEFAKIKAVKSLLLTSSGAIYGRQPSNLEHIDEDYIGAPITSDFSSVYGEGKRMAEVLCAVYHKHYKLPVKIARCYAFVGPFLPLDGTFAVGNFIKNVINNETILIEGDGTPHRSYMYAGDLMIWLWTILLKGVNNRPYNVGSEQSISIKTLADLVAKDNVNGQIAIIVKTPESDKPPLRYVPSITRAKEELGLKIYTDLETAIKKTIFFNRNKITAL